METVKLALVDNDYVVCAKTAVALGNEQKKFEAFLKEINDELILGRTARLEIGGSLFEISRVE